MIKANERGGRGLLTACGPKGVFISVPQARQCLSKKLENAWWGGGGVGGGDP
jgi:hypothetical protein